MKILSLFYILLLFNNSIQLNYQEYDMDYITNLKKEFSMDKKTRSLQVNANNTSLDIYNRELKDKVP